MTEGLRATGSRCAGQGPLSDEQEPDVGAPPAVEPVGVEDAPAGTAVQHRDATEVTVHRGRAEGDDPELALQLEVDLGERVRLEVGRGR